MDILITIVLAFFGIGILVNMISGYPHEKLEKAKAELAEFEAEREEAIAKAQAELKETATKNLEGKHLEGETRTLSFFSLISLSTLPFGDMLDSTKKADPLIPLIIIYCWLEQLSENYIWPGSFDVEEYPEKTSSLTKFIWDFTKSELTDEEWESTFFMLDEKDDVNSNAFFDEISGFRFVRDRIVGAFEDSSIEEKSNMCAIFSSELIEYINDDDLKERFITLATSSLNDAGLMSSSAQSTLAALEL